MNQNQFIYWLKGFAKAVNEEGPTPRQWAIIASELNQIKDCPDYSSKIDDYNVFSNWTSTASKVNKLKDNNQLELDLN